MNINLLSKNEIESFTYRNDISGKFLSLIYLLSVALYYLDKSQTLKYFQYILPVLGLIVSLQSIHKVWYTSGDMAKLFRVLLVLSFVNLCVVLIRGVFYAKFLQEGFLFIGALLFAITVIGNYAYFVPRLINNTLYLLVGIFLIDKGSVLLSVLSDPGALLLGVITSSVTTESSLSFYFAILSFYFVIEKDKMKAMVSIIFMILSFKRIACVGFMASVILYNTMNILNVKYNRRFYASLITVFNFAYIWGLILLVSGTFDEMISNVFGVSSNFLFMGRVDMYTNIFSKLGHSNVFGIGIGRVADYLSNYVESGIGEGLLTNIHSDILKYYLELGVVGFLVFIYKFSYFLSRNLSSFCFLIMLNIILLTDNVSIYFGFMVLFFLINFKLSCMGRTPSRVKANPKKEKILYSINHKKYVEKNKIRELISI